MMVSPTPTLSPARVASETASSIQPSLISRKTMSNTPTIRVKVVAVPTRSVESGAAAVIASPVRATIVEVVLKESLRVVPSNA